MKDLHIEFFMKAEILQILKLTILTEELKLKVS